MPDPLALLRARQSYTNFTPAEPAAPTAFTPTNPLSRLLFSWNTPQARTMANPSPYDREQSARDHALVDANDAQQRAELDAMREATLSARMQGFASPQASAQYGRQVEQQKLRQPLEVAKISAQTIVDRMKEQQDAQDARTQAQIMSREKIAGAGQATREELASRQVPPQLSSRLQTARDAYRGDVGGPDIFGIGDWLQSVSGKRDAYLASLTDVLRRTGSLDEITDRARQAATAGQSADQVIAAAAEKGLQFDPDEVEALRLFVEQFSQGR